MGRIPEELELDVDKDILDIQVVPPRKGLVDYLPDRLIGWLREKFRWPLITKYERWLLCLVFLKTAAGLYASTARRLLQATEEREKKEFGYVLTSSKEGYEPEGGWN